MRGTNTFMGGLMRGYEFADDQYDEEAARERQERLDAERQAQRVQENRRAQERLGLQRQAGERADERLEITREQNELQNERQQERIGLARDRLGLQEEEFEFNRQTAEAEASREAEQADRERREQQAQRYLEEMIHYAENDMTIPEETLTGFREATNVDLLDAARPGYRQAVNALEGALENPQDVNSPEVLSAMNRVYKDEIRKVVGKKTKRGETITDVRISGVYPGRQEGTFATEVQVTAQGEDGKARRYNAPITELRAADDANVKQITLDDAVNTLAGRKGLAMWLENNPKLEGRLRGLAARYGADVEGSEDAPWRSFDGGLYRQDTGEVRPASDLPGGAGRGDLKASDENAINNYVAGLYQGRYDPQSGEFLGLKKGTERMVRGIASEASLIYARGEARTRNRAVDMAAERYGIDIPRPGQGEQNGRGRQEETQGQQQEQRQEAQDQARGDRQPERSSPYRGRTGEPRDAGSGQRLQENDAPYPDGTKLRGPDGRMYRVEGGVPVPIEEQ